ncbi:hypothetical protein QQF64_013403 [Cirrhinus molitorella]|uniref:Uncharacterized protein n=1 Tax=Cirrhinus molitorella TaxID=172907 RepID=A0ABR3LUR2_9TELE
MLLQGVPFLIPDSFNIFRESIFLHQLNDDDFSFPSFFKSTGFICSLLNSLKLSNKPLESGNSSYHSGSGHSFLLLPPSSLDVDGSLSNIHSVSHYGKAPGVTDCGNTNYTTSANHGRPIAAAIRESCLPVYKPQIAAVSSFSLSSPWKIFGSRPQQTLGITAQQITDEAASTQGSSLSSGKQNRDAEAVSVGLARERLNLNAVGLPPKVIETIQNARAASTRSLYSLKWGVFKAWCAERHVVPYLCSISDMLCFLQDLLDKGRAFSTVKVNLAAISACHIRLDTGTHQHPLVCRFMRGARWLRSVSKPLVPPWDLSVVLNALSKAPFEPVESIPLKLLSLKTALLLALTTAKFTLHA